MRSGRWFKVLWFPLLGLTIAGASLVLYFHSPGPGSSILLDNSLRFDYPSDADRRWAGIVEKGRLQDRFRKEKGNIFFPDNPWAGRLRLADISFQCLFALDDSRIEFPCRDRDAEAIDFSIYNPGDSDLTYELWVETRSGKEMVFRRRFRGDAFHSERIDLERFRPRLRRLWLRTTGRGGGAWINPRLIRSRENPKLMIVIMLDTLRADHMSLYGYGRKTTPAIDDLSRESLVFENAYSTTSWTLPAHVSLFSGKEILDHGVLSQDNRIAESYPLFPEILQRRGYATAAFTGGGFIEDNYGFHRGFQIYSNRPGDIFHLNSAELVFDNFRTFLERNRDGDCFLFLHTYQMHAPYKAPAPYFRAFNPQLKNNMKGVSSFLQLKTEAFKPLAPEQRQELVDLYDAAILYTDQALVKKLIDYLKANNLYDQSLLVILSDHGEEFFDHGSWEHGHTLYRELIRIPLLVKFPRQRRTGIEKKLTSITDIGALILKEAGIAAGGWDHRPGEHDAGGRILTQSLPVSPVIKNAPPRVSFVDDRFHFLFNLVDREKLKTFVPPPAFLPSTELYRMDQDPREGENLYFKRKTDIARFEKLLKSYLSRIGRLKTRDFKMDPDLRNKLKSLGYLND